MNRLGTKAGNGCVVCALPLLNDEPDCMSHAFAAALAFSETVKGDPSAIDACRKHRDMIDAHRAIHKEMLARSAEVQPVAAHTTEVN